MGIKRLIISALLVCLLATPAFAVKKTLLFVDEDNTYTGWAKTVIGGVVSFYGGDLQYIHCNSDADTIANTLARAVASDEYGLVILCIDDMLNFRTDAHGKEYGKGKMVKYFAAMDESPIGIPQLLIARKYIDYYSSTLPAEGPFYCGVDTTEWQDRAVGDGGMWDSLWVETSAGDTMLWWHGTAAAPLFKFESDASKRAASPGYWSPDVWVKGNTNNWLLWHSQPREASTGTDTIQYFLPNFGAAENTGYDAPIKALCALLKKFDCIEYIPFYVSMDDYGFNLNSIDSTGIADSTANLFNWCEDNGIFMNVFTQRCDADATVYPAHMAHWANSDYIKFGWGADDIYNNGTQGKRQIFYDWGNDAAETGDSLYIKLQWDRDRLASEGFHTYMDNKNFFTFAQTNYSGADGYNLADTIITALAATGVRTFRVSTATAGGHYHTGVSWFSIFYPHKDYPVDLTWTGTAQTVYVDFLAWNYADNCGGFADVGADSIWASPALMSAESLMTVSPDKALMFYSYFGTKLLGNSRKKDGSGTGWSAGTVAEWPHLYNVESRGMSFFSHHNDVKQRYDMVIYNAYKLWLEHYWNNLNAYNGIAGAQVFRPMFMEDVPQRWSDKFPK